LVFTTKLLLEVPGGGDEHNKNKYSGRARQTRPPRLVAIVRGRARITVTRLVLSSPLILPTLEEKQRYFLCSKTTLLEGGRVGSTLYNSFSDSDRDSAIFTEEDHDLSRRGGGRRPPTADNLLQDPHRGGAAVQRFG